MATRLLESRSMSPHRTLALLVCLGVSACTDPPNAIGGELSKSSSGGRLQFEINRQGSGWVEYPQKRGIGNASVNQALLRIRFQGSPLDYEHVLSLLAPLESYADKPRECTAPANLHVTDVPYPTATATWQRRQGVSKLIFQLDCLDTEEAGFDARLRAVAQFTFRRAHEVPVSASERSLPSKNASYP